MIITIKNLQQQTFQVEFDPAETVNICVNFLTRVIALAMTRNILDVVELSYCHNLFSLNNFHRTVSRQYLIVDGQKGRRPNCLVHTKITSNVFQLKVLQLKQKIEAERGKEYATESQKLIYVGTLYVHF